MKKRVLFIYGPLNAGGAEHVLLDLLASLDRDKYEIELCQTVAGGTLIHEVPKDVKVFALWQSYNWHYKVAHRASVWVGSDFLFRKVLQHKIHDEYDVVISFLEGMPLKIHSILRNKAYNISWVHADMYDHRYTAKNFHKKNELSAYNKMDVVVCVSEFSAQKFIQRFAGFNKKLTTIDNPVATNNLHQLAEAFGPKKCTSFCIVAVGRLTEPKRIDRLLRVAALCKKDQLPVQFQIVGDGELRDELQNIARELNVYDKVEFAGYQSNPYPFIKAADVLISTSAYEGFGLVLVEAMALGVPVISTKTVGPSEILQDDTYGLLTEHDEYSIFEAVKKMYTDAELRDQYIIKGKVRAQDYDVSHALQAFDCLIENSIPATR